MRRSVAPGRYGAAVRDGPPVMVGDGGPFLSHDPDATGGDGPLAGWDVAVKDLIAVAGRVRSDGSASRDGDAAQAVDAPVVAALRQAGARIVGTTALHELACGVTGVNGHQGTPRNPAAPDRVPGGSSSGSAVAVASGLARAALGTDTGGSVRIPSACCGVVGWKPRRGAIPLDGVTPCAPSLDHVGVHTRAVSDAATVLAALGVDVGAGAAADALPVIGVDRAAVDAADERVAGPIADALDRLTSLFDLRDVEPPDPRLVARVSTTILLSEFAAVHADMDADRRARLGADIRARLERGAAYTDAEVADARAGAEDIRAGMDDLLGSVAAVVGPTLPVPPPTSEQAATGEDLARLLVAGTRLANVAGCPALTLPLAVSPPVGLQLVAATDAGLHAVAATVEATLG